jgi:uncharacterized protein (DUF362 family)
VSGLGDRGVGVAHDPTARAYPPPPFSAPEAYPELRALAGSDTLDPTNRVYPLVRQALQDLGLDAARAGTDRWNPLGDIIRAGDTVLLKPNLVRHFHGYGWDPLPLVAHASVLRVVLDYVDLALAGTGRIVIADAPLQTTDFDAVTRLSRVRDLVDWYEKVRGRALPLHDLRLTHAVTTRGGYITGHAAAGGDDDGYAAIDMGAASLLAQISGTYAGFRVTNYDPAAMEAHHNLQRHEYLIARRVLNADVVINLPKLKTHRKVGVTASLKNLIGINGHKDWLPHHRRGALEDGHGDEYLHRNRMRDLVGRLLDVEEAQSNPLLKRAVRFVRRAAGGASLLTRRDPFMEGSWWGNDTLWRTVLDLNRILYYADRNGVLQAAPTRRVLTLIDGVVAGEAEGPLEAKEKICGLILAGHNPVAVDAVAARLMGFDYRRIPIIARAEQPMPYPLLGFPFSDVEVHSSQPQWDRLDLLASEPSFTFEPAAGWKGVIELG